MTKAAAKNTKMKFWLPSVVEYFETTIAKNKVAKLSPANVILSNNDLLRMPSDRMAFCCSNAWCMTTIAKTIPRTIANIVVSKADSEVRACIRIANSRD